ncbi:DNA methyltransferase [Paenibacillus gansuensis]|uniref:DNA methyltransferase n=1 Tax=Paenibacillus gansuensis TaxID=306542 RepID=A0ABW5P6J4_9BACL
MAYNNLLDWILLSIKGYPARFPSKLPEFFIKYLTDPNDTVVDIFVGSNTTGEAAEALDRKWLSCDLDIDYVAASSFRFINNEIEAKEVHEKILNNEYVNLSDYTLV